VFNLQGSEIIFILLLALVVLGPEKLPGAIRRAMQTYHELRKLGTGFQSEFKSVMDEPMREIRETAELVKEQADPQRIADEAERAARAADRADADLAAAVEQDSGPAIDEMAEQMPDVSEPDPFDDPLDDPYEESA
jgi:sec-independent protein translocase protein TatB